MRNDDVLQVKVFSDKMGKAQRVQSLFEWFRETDQVFEKYNIPCILSVLSEGIEVYPEWVSYIKNNLHRFQIELHGFQHDFYNDMSAEEGYRNLKQAREEIEDTFNIKITTWYVPFGKKKFPVWGKEVCDKLGIDFDVTGNNKGNQRYFHYWYKKNQDSICKLLEGICHPQFVSS